MIFSEYGSLRDLYKNPMHPYTLGLFGSLPDLDSDVERLRPIPGMLPDPSIKPVGCPFVERCEHATDLCRQQKPELKNVGGIHTVRCHYAEVKEQ